MSRKPTLALVIGTGLLFLTGRFVEGQGARSSASAQLQNQQKFVKAQHPVANSYIVVLDETSLDLADLPTVSSDATPEQKEAAIKQRNQVISQRVKAKALGLAQAHRGRLGHVYDYVLRGFQVELSEAEALALSRNPDVLYVEEDSSISGNQLTGLPPSLGGKVLSCMWTQTGAPWGLDRIDQSRLPMDGAFGPGCDSGNGVHAYVIDSGVRITHQDFGGRATNDANFVMDGQNGNDCNGHGTHVAGTIGGATYGVAKSVRIHSVKVLDCSNRGTTANFIAGVNWVTANHANPAVANLSISSDAPSTSLDFAVRNLIAAGVTTVVAAGNGGSNCTAVDVFNVSPARVTEAITVAATDNRDTRWVCSNFGNFVDVFAPGVSILSAGIANDTAQNTMTGTSMAAPHVTGVVARYLERNPRQTPSQVEAAVTMLASRDVVVNPGTDSRNRLVQSNINIQPGYYVIRAKHSGKVMDVIWASQSNGAQVAQSDYWGGDNQKFLLTPVGDGYFKITAKHSGKALNIWYISTANGAPVEQWDYFGGDSQKFMFIPAHDGYYQIMVKHSGKAVDVEGPSLANGALVHQWDYWGLDNQIWRLEPVQ